MPSHVRDVGVLCKKRGSVDEMGDLNQYFDAQKKDVRLQDQ